MQLSIHDIFEVTDPFGKIMLSTEKIYRQFQGIHRPPEIHSWDSCVRINHPEKKPIPVSLWPLLLWANVHGNKIKCQSKTRIQTLNYHHRKAQSKAGRWYRMRGGNQEKVARSEAEDERRGVTAGAQWRPSVPHTHTFAAPFHRWGKQAQRGNSSRGRKPPSGQVRTNWETPYIVV